MVRILRDGRLSAESMVARVVVLPLPVGPVTAIIPCGRSSSRRSFFVMRREAQSGNVEQTAIARQQANDSGLAVLGRHCGDTDVDIGARRLQPRGTVLREAPFCDVQARQNLDP